MKSRFFTDTQELDYSPPPCDKVCVCLMLSREAYDQAVRNASRLHITSGEYIDRLIASRCVSVCGTRVPPPADNPWPCFPPAPPDH